MPHVQLKKYPNYFISSNGHVFKIENGKEVIIEPKQSKKTKKLYVLIEKQYYELVYLMIEHFNLKLTPYDSLRYTVSKDLRIQLNSIRIKPFIDKYGLSKEDEAKLITYKCDTKANSANARSLQKISAIEVFTALKAHDCRCVYCGVPLTPEDWHLDHFTSLHKGGFNIFENIVPSCSVCNIMKGGMEGHQFHTRCLKIAKNFAFLQDCDEKRKRLAELLRAA